MSQKGEKNASRPNASTEFYSKEQCMLISTKENNHRQILKTVEELVGNAATIIPEKGFRAGSKKLKYTCM